MTAYTDLKKGFELGPWQVLPDRGLLRDGETQEHVEPLPMDVLVVLASRQGEVVGPDVLVDEVWDGRPVTDEVITRCISVLRRSLGDDARNPTYIETVQKRGYRLKMPLKVPESVQAEPTGSWRPGYLLPLVAGFAAVVLIVLLAFFVKDPPPLEDSALRSVVVFPFECGSEGNLCFGFPAALAATLYQVDNLNVVMSREPFPANRSVEEVADDFGVDGVITGSVGLAGRRLLITAELVDGRNGFVYWSNHYPGNVEEIIELQEILANDVLGSIRQDTTSKLTAQSRPASFAAFDKFAEGQWEFDKRSQASISKAIELFEETIRLDPDYGPGYLMVATAYLIAAGDNYATWDELFAQATELAELAVQVDPDLRQPAQTLYGFMHHKRGEWTAADEAYQEALRGDIVFPITHHLYSRFLASTGRLQESLDQAILARGRDPHSPILISRLAIAYFWMDDLENAERYFERANRTELESPIHFLAFALLKIRQNRVDEAREWAKDGLIQFDQDYSWVDTVFDGLGDDPSKRQEAHALVAQMSADGTLAARVEITLWVILGDSERAMAVARQLVNGEVFEADILFIEQFQLLRDHPDFRPLMEEIGMTEHWSSVGCEWKDAGLQCANSPSASR